MAYDGLDDEVIFGKLKLRGGRKHLTDDLKRQLRESGALDDFRANCAGIDEIEEEDALFDLESIVNKLLRSRSSKDDQGKSVTHSGRRKYIAYVYAVKDFVETEAKQMPCVVDFQMRVLRRVMGQEQMWKVLTNPTNQFLSIGEIKELGVGIYKEQQLLLEKTVRVNVNQPGRREVMTIILQIETFAPPYRLRRKIKCDPNSMIELTKQPLYFTGRSQITLSTVERDWPEADFQQGASATPSRPIRGLPGSVVGEALEAVKELCRQYHFDPLQALILLFTGRYQPPLSLQLRTRIYESGAGGFIRLDVPFFTPSDQVAEHFQGAVQQAIGKRFRHLDDHSIDLFEFVNREKNNLDDEGKAPSWEVLHLRWEQWCEAQKQAQAAPSTEQEAFRRSSRQPETSNERQTFVTSDNFRSRYQLIKKNITPRFQKET